MTGASVTDENGLGGGFGLGLRRLGNGCGCGVKRGGNAALGVDLNDGLADGNGFTLRCEQRDDRSRERAGQFHEGLGGFDLDENVVDGNRVANLDAPLNDFGFGQTFTNVRQREINNGHG